MQVEDSPGILVESPTRFGEGDPPGPSVEERDSKLFFEDGNSLAHGRRVRPRPRAAAVKLPCSAARTNVERCGSSASPEAGRDSAITVIPRPSGLEPDFPHDNMTSGCRVTATAPEHR